MNRRFFIAALLILLIFVGVYWRWNKQPGLVESPPPQDVSETTNADVVVAPVAEVVEVEKPPQALEVIQPESNAAEIHREPESSIEHTTTEAQPVEDDILLLEPDQQLDVVRQIFRNYSQRFRGNPVGNNAEITAALMGDNPGGVNFLQAARNAINDRGELTDHWGTPYFFHQLSGYEMETHSAGPDKIMGTRDDLITK